MKTLALGFSIVFIIFYFNKVTAQNKQIVDSLLQIVNTKTTDTTLIKVYNDLGIQYASSNHFKAKNFIKKALQIAHKIKSPRGIAGANNCLGIVYYYQKEYDSALIHFKKAFSINKKIEHLWGQASALHQIGAVQNFQSNYFEAIESFKKSGTLFLKLKDSVSYIKSIENTGVSYLLMRYDKKSLEYLFKANTLYEKLGNTAGLGRTNIQISNILIREEQYSKALEFLERALPGVIKAGNKIHLQVVLKNLGVAKKGLKHYSEALFYYKRSLQLAKTIKNDSRIASLKSLIGDVYYDNEKYDSAKIHLKEALKNYKKNDYKDQTYTHIALSKVFLKLHQLDSVKLHANSATIIAQKVGRLDLEKEATEILAVVAEKQGDSITGFTYYKKVSILKDSIAITEEQNQARELQAKYEVDRKEKEIQRLTEVQKNTKSNYAIIFILFSIALSLLYSATLIFRKKVKESLTEKEQLNDKLYEIQKELQTKSKELTTNTLHLATKNKTLATLKKEVESIKYGEDQNTQYKYQKLLQTINFSITGDKDWDNFKRYFEDLHKDFYTTIKTNYPTVTTNELRLMALLKMNLSTKEIAVILNITQEGVRKARYRLRKKLKIDSNTKLTNLVLSI